MKHVLVGLLFILVTHVSMYLGLDSLPFQVVMIFGAFTFVMIAEAVNTLIKALS
jgi:diacylglycerol kinase